MPSNLEMKNNLKMYVYSNIPLKKDLAENMIHTFDGFHKKKWELLKSRAKYMRAVEDIKLAYKSGKMDEKRVVEILNAYGLL